MYIMQSFGSQRQWLNRSTRIFGSRNNTRVTTVGLELRVDYDATFNENSCRYKHIRE